MTLMTNAPRPPTDAKSLRQSFWGSAERRACSVFRHALSAKARRASGTDLGRPALVLAPHADDETLGCGGTIALKRQAGTRVDVIIASDGSASHRYERTLETQKPALIALRQMETKAACQTLGVSPDRVGFLGFEDSRLSNHIPEIRNLIIDLIRETGAQEVYVCAQRDGHPDHVALATAARLALFELTDPAITLLEYPVWSFDFRSWRPADKTNTVGFLLGLQEMARDAASWRMRSVLIASVQGIKADALTAHRSQLGQYQPEPHWSGLPVPFLAHFLGEHELFREIIPNRGELS